MALRVSLFLLSQIRKLSTSKSLKSRKNHYNSLGLTKNATQADVKGAYYELSKVYHPDKNQGHTDVQREEHAQKFRDITEAYEVLGNTQSRRLYDKGFMGDLSHTTRAPPKEDPLHKFYKSRETRHRPPPPNGRTPIYDFDEWSKQHYHRAFARSQEMKHRHAFYDKLNKEDKEDQKINNLIWAAIVITLICALIKETKDADFDRLRKTQEYVNSLKLNENSTEIAK